MKVSKQKRVKLLDTSQKNETTAIVLDKNEKSTARNDRNTTRSKRKNAQK